MRQSRSAFSLAELLVAISVLALVAVLIAQLANSATRITTLANKRIDADSTVRPVFDRMALDLAQMIKRKDVSYYFKTAATAMSGNDLMAFYSNVPGYYATTPSPVSVVAYRINSDPNQFAYNRLERMGKGLPWNGSSGSDAPVTFLPLTIDSIWPAVASSATYDSTDPHSITYEIIGPQIFRFEYYFLDSNGSLLMFPSGWTSSSSINLDSVAAIVVAIAVIDPKSKVLLSTAQIDTLRQRLSDYNGEPPGDFVANWQSILDQITDMPRSAISGVRLYERYFSLK
jgi:hypothetical protein